MQESGEMYLENIYVLSQKSESVRSIDICEFMGFSKPSVSRAVGLLKKNGYINVDRDGHITLTAEGLCVAKKIYERHTLITDALIGIGVEPTVAAEDACKIEHDISDASFEALKAHLQSRHC